MKLYHFNANNYDYEFYVMAADKYHAYNALMQYLHDERDKAEKFTRDHWSEEIGKWQTVTNPADPAAYPKKYTLDEYEEGQVIRSEVA